LLKFSFQGRPGYAISLILVERTEAALKLGFLCTGQGKLLMFETIPKLRNERQSFRGRQTNDLVSREHFHAFQPTKNKVGEQGLRKAPELGERDEPKHPQLKDTARKRLAATQFQPPQLHPVAPDLCKIVLRLLYSRSVALLGLTRR